jgi:putative transcriptional regulator
VSESLAGQLLIASPSIGDVFRRSVVLMVEHDEEGAFGLVLNQPSDSTVGELLDGELGQRIPPELVIHVGGPVQPGAVTVIAEHPEPLLASKLVVGTVGVVDLDDTPELARVRVFAGYAGWGPGQLDAEIEAEGWIVEPARPDDAFSEGDLWSRALARKGGEFELLARMPPDPSLN